MPHSLSKKLPKQFYSDLNQSKTPTSNRTDKGGATELQNKSENSNNNRQIETE